jgi:iron complex transport system substrate-binding protein
LAADLARHAGLEQQPFASERVDLERLLANPPEVIVVTRYRAQQTSLNQLWLSHPALRQLPASTRIVEVDGRAWTCMGPLVADEVAGLRARLAS